MAPILATQLVVSSGHAGWLVGVIVINAALNAVLLAVILSRGFRYAAIWSAIDKLRDTIATQSTEWSREVRSFEGRVARLEGKDRE